MYSGIGLSFRVPEATWIRALIIFVPAVLLFGGGPLWIYYYVLSDSPRERQVAALRSLAEADPVTDARADIADGKTLFLSVTMGGDGDHMTRFPGIELHRRAIERRCETRDIDVRPAYGLGDYSRLATAALAYAERFNLVMAEARSGELTSAIEAARGD